VSTSRLTYEDLLERLRQTEEWLADCQRQRDAATTIARLQATQLRAVNWELHQVEERERQRLAQALHDQLQQLLVAARLKLTKLGRLLPDHSRQILHQIDDLLNDGITETRSLTARLVPAQLAQASLAASLQWLAKHMEATFGLHVDLVITPNSEPSAEDIRQVLFQATREILFNVVKHAHVNAAVVELRRSNDEQIHLVICDAGRGFDPQDLAPSASSAQGFGLACVCQRLQWIGGSVEINSAPGQGTRVSISAPACQAATAAPPARYCPSRDNRYSNDPVFPPAYRR